MAMEAEGAMAVEAAAAAMGAAEAGGYSPHPVRGQVVARKVAMVAIRDPGEPVEEGVGLAVEVEESIRCLSQLWHSATAEVHLECQRQHRLAALMT